MSSVLYLTRTGMLEPLGQSQVMAYLRGLSADYRITLISFERAEDLAQIHDVARVRADCDVHGIRWLPQRYRDRPRFVAPAYNMLLMLWLCFRQKALGHADFVHARSYLPAFIALVMNLLSDTPFVFDMRALWPDELITSGRLRRGSFMHRVIVGVEGVCLARAAETISLTHAAEAHLRQFHSRALEGRPIAVIPTCADLSRFVPTVPRAPNPRVYGCLGSVLSGWFRLSWLAACFRVAAERDPLARFQLVTRDDPQQVRAAVDPDGVLLDRLQIFAMPSRIVHEAIQMQDVSVMFYAGGEVSELGRSPTRLGEVLGCGLPVLANAGVGDVAQIVDEYRVGVLVADGSDEAMTAALDALDSLMLEPDVAARCRQAAEAVFSLDAGTRALRAVYQRVAAVA